MSTLPAFTHSTCIVVLISPDAIYIGADSKSAGANGTASIENKIQVFDKYCVAVAGIGRNTHTGFYPYNILKTTLSNKKYDDIKDALESKFDESIKQELHYVRINEAVKKFFKNGKAILNYIVIGFKDNKPFAHCVTYRIKSLEEETFEKESNFKYNTGATWILGENKEAMEFLDNNPNYMAGGPTEFINKMMDVSISYHPEFVGKPITIYGAAENAFVKLQ